eukprot:COSAG05_NODE_127_length_17241_cov_7.514817_5_plen_108_part_00
MRASMKNEKISKDPDFSVSSYEPALLATDSLSLVQTLNPIAKGLAIEAYGEGTWLVLEYSRPIRVQLLSIDGLSTVSAAMLSRTSTTTRTSRSGITATTTTTTTTTG